VRGVDDEGRRTDLAVTVLDGRAIHATVRTQAAEGVPTNSVHGGRSTAVDPGLLPAGTRQLAVDAVRATGNRYGSTDIFGAADSPVAGEVNVMPGGRSPGFLERVIDPLVSAYVAEIERRPCASGWSLRAYAGISSRVLAVASAVTMDSAPAPYFVR
jgi:glutathione synthase/RimK-type ligase-like ATP-grasp enzyme